MTRWCTSFATDAELRFRFTLARKLGMTVHDLSRRMSVAEYRQWQAYAVAELGFIGDAAGDGKQWGDPVW